MGILHECLTCILVKSHRHCFRVNYPRCSLSPTLFLMPLPRTGSIPEELGQLSLLEKLDLAQNNFGEHARLSVCSK